MNSFLLRIQISNKRNFFFFYLGGGGGGLVGEGWRVNFFFMYVNLIYI